jgi:acetate kinase
MNVLVINSGSSSIKFTIYASPAASDGLPLPLLDGELAGIGGPGASLDLAGTQTPARRSTLDATNLTDAIEILLDSLLSPSVPSIEAVGHRVVHPGPKIHDHQRITPQLLHELEAAVEFAPLHDPGALQIIRAAMQRLPAVPHFACFDTVFHRTMPLEASSYAIPAEYRDQGVRRYGFHGLSCESVVLQLTAAGPLPERLVIAHLGSGCSVTAVLHGKSVDTTMGLTPTGGVIMGTRPGDLDPGLLLYLLRRQQGPDPAGTLEHMLNHSCGLVALSGCANDMQAIRRAADEGSPQAALALKVFTRSITKAIGSFCWSLGGLDAIVFTGGIGEHDSRTRSEILAGLKSLGIALDAELNEQEGAHLRSIGASASNRSIMVAPAQEDRMIAIHVDRMAHSHARPPQEGTP